MPGQTAKAGKVARAFKRAFGEPGLMAQDNFTDPDSRIMKTGTGFEQCFNAQAAVDSHRQIVVANGLTQCALDSDELLGMLEAVRRNTGQDATGAVADAGYGSEAVLAQLSVSPANVIVALGREGRQTRQCHGLCQIPRTQGHCRATQRLDQAGDGIRAVQLSERRRSAQRVQARLRNAQLAANGSDNGLRVLRSPRAGLQPI